MFCRDQLGELARRQSDFEALGASVVGISVDPVEKSAAHHARERYNFPLLADPDGATIDAYGLRMVDREIAVPAVFLVDRSGRIRWRYVSRNKKDRPSADMLLESLKTL